MTNFVWIVEIQIDEHWKPCVGIGLDKADAQIEMTRWKKKNPDDTFRIMLYETSEEQQ